jgi:hypothetical protein
LAIGLKEYGVPILGENPDAFKKHDKDRKNISSDPIMGHDLKSEKHCSMKCQIDNS